MSQSLLQATILLTSPKLPHPVLQVMMLTYLEVFGDVECSQQRVGCTQPEERLAAHRPVPVQPVQTRGIELVDAVAFDALT